MLPRRYGLCYTLILSADTTQSVLPHKYVASHSQTVEGGAVAVQTFQAGAIAVQTFMAGAIAICTCEAGAIAVQTFGARGIAVSETSILQGLTFH